jgi:hypothetical protein
MIVMVAAAPAVTVCGEMAVTAGVGLVTLNVIVPEAPPPGAGLDTATISAALPATSPAGSVAFSSLELTTVVASGEPFQWIKEDGTKPLPVKSSATGPDPAITLAGVTAFTIGSGLFTTKLVAADVPPLGAGLFTATVANAPFAKSLAGTAAVRLVVEV